MAYLGRQPNTGVRSRYIYTATASQTTFSGTDDDGKTLKYEDAAYVDVFLNGVLLKPVTDYTATSKTSIVLASGAASGDILEIVAYDIANIADTVSKANGGTFEAAITVQGTVTSTGNTVNGNLSVDGGTIKLDGNHPVGTGNVALGDTALDSNVSGSENTAIGADALTAHTTGYNTAVGYQAGYSNTSGQANISVGGQALYSTTTSNNNTGVGFQALYDNSTGANNTSLGAYALTNNSTASNNTAVGYQAAYSNSTGIGLVAVGALALNSNTTGVGNVAVGTQHTGFAAATLQSNTTGSYNTAIGTGALYANTTSSYSTAVGYQAGYSSVGAGNTFIGYYSGLANTASGGSINTFVGYYSGSSITSGEKNTILGAYNGNQSGLDIRTSNNNIVLSDGDGNPRIYVTSDGSIYAPAISYAAASSDLNYNTSTGELFVVSSSQRYKENISNYTDTVIDKLNSITVKTFDYKDGGETNQVGLIAEEVNEQIPFLVNKREIEGFTEPQPDTVKYSQLSVFLLKAIQEQQTTIQELSAKNDALEARITALENA